MEAQDAPLSLAWPLKMDLLFFKRELIKWLSTNSLGIKKLLFCIWNPLVELGSPKLIKTI